MNSEPDNPAGQPVSRDGSARDDSITPSSEHHDLEPRAFPPPGQEPDPHAAQQPMITDWSIAPTPPLGFPVVPGLPGPPPSRPPGLVKRWLEIPGIKMLCGLIAALILLLAGMSLFSSDPAPSGTYDPLQFAKSKNPAEYLSTRPREAVQRLYSAIGRRDASLACAYFDDVGRQQFVANMGYPDCAAALNGLISQVKDERDYAASVPLTGPNPPTGNTARIDSCDYNVQGGPNLGIFTLNKNEQGLWLITGHKKGPEPCPAKTPTSEPTFGPNPTPTQTSTPPPSTTGVPTIEVPPPTSFSYSAPPIT